MDNTERRCELLMNIRQFMILNIEIKKLMTELDVNEEIYNVYEEITKMVREPNKTIYKKFYNGGKEIYYAEYNKKRKDIAWFPTIDYKRCKNCKKCIDFCPKCVYELENNKTTVKRPFNCIINCNACSYICCENNAIIFPDKKYEKIGRL
ncbi:4Fe-4S dicluster domain-containing protein [Methanococcus aeolicus]|uniref:4Fe-4S ferredoxin iron-sulfur binding domain protein n=1 Tax=Methanococcus aeolicus (strain ATCC BAA-1280 / DSM 17508 / OCM 812 / Nankai-3) TaxID=419665 RepID=A6UT91_META3|nr:ferredoxin [Methanococcus aeolicus]ABR55713.1 4Fe-4S ferredoxin iron-sulfur binding domain protein [Methanococcus aeolicus Nankai-3]UXM85207.1 ferredoxin [Methanococcus aeolicus]